MERFFRITRPREGVVPKGARPGGIWKEVAHVVPGTVRNHRVIEGYLYIQPEGEEGPPPFEGVQGLYPRRESIPVTTVADADARREKEREAGEDIIRVR